MSRLQYGEDDRIDLINNLVFNIKNNIQFEESCVTLLDMFKPLLLKTCNKWAIYFRDEQHNLKRFDELMADAQYWFIKYTIEKYTIDGEATFNTFIKNHIDQRIRYIFEQELKYYSNNIFPDPNKNDDDMCDIYESVAYKYRSGSAHYSDIADGIIDDEVIQARIALFNRIKTLATSNIFNNREKIIFEEILCKGTTHNEVGEMLHVSRTRITQILKKIKSKLYKLINEDSEAWELIIKADIDFKEQ